MGRRFCIAGRERWVGQLRSVHPQSGAWTPAGPLPAPYEHLLTTILANGKVLVTGRPGSNDLTGNDGYPTPQGGAE